MRADELPPERIRAAANDLLVLVRARLPERFYREPPWRMFATAFIARMAGTVETMMDLADDGRQADSAVLLRALYEHMVTFAWILVDPEPRLDWWADDARREMRKLHNDADVYGMGFLSEADQARGKVAKELPPLDQQAAEVDKFWTLRLPGFRAHAGSGPKDIRTVRGLYVAVYRVASRSAHGQPQSLNGVMVLDEYPHVVQFERDDSTMSSFLALPIFGMALLVCNHRLGWPDDDAVKAIGEALLHDVVDDD